MKNVDFVQKIFLIKLWKNGETNVIVGHNFTFAKEKSNIPANLSKNDLLNFEGKNEKFLKI